MGDARLPFLARVFWLAILMALASACTDIDSETATDSDVARLRALFDGSRPLPDRADRDEDRRAFARTAVRASGLRRSDIDIDSDEGWSPVVERDGKSLLAMDPRPWQEAGDIDGAGSFAPLRSDCGRAAAIDVAGLPEEIARPDPQPGARRLACALDRIAGRELRVKWAERQERGAIVDMEQGVASVNPRLLALIEPDGGSARPPAAGGVPFTASGDDKSGASQGGDPAAAPLDIDDNDHHPPPKKTTTNDDSGRTACDKACDDVWNKTFDCNCNGSPGSTSSNGCDCNNSPGSTGSSGCGSSACKCAHATRGIQDRTGFLASAAFLGVLLLRRRRKLRLGRWARFLALFCVVAALALWATRAVAGPTPSPKLVDVHVTVAPPEAAVFMDGNAVAPKDGILRVPAGHHTFSAQLDGYAPAEQAVDVPEKGAGTLVTLRLVADRGYLTVSGSIPQLVIELDGKQVGTGSYAGLVAPGRHIVTATFPGGGSRSYAVDAVAGQSFAVSTDSPPTYAPPPPPPPEKPAAKPDSKPDTPSKPRPPQPHGPYIQGNLTMVWQSSRPYDFEHTGFPAPGFALGARGGYRFDRILSAEALIEYARVANSGVVLQTYDIDQNGDGVVNGGEAATDRSPGDYTLESLRFGPLLHFTSSGPIHRFAGGVGLGAMLEVVSLNHADLLWSFGKQKYVSQGTFHHHYEGWTPYLIFEAGYERSVGHLLGDLAFQFTIESVSGIDGQPYNSSVQARIGLSLRVGYATW